MNPITPSLRGDAPTVPLASLLCLVMGGFQLMGHGPAWLLWCSMITLSVVGFWGLARLLFMPQFVTAWSVYGVSVALAYGFGALNTFASGYMDGLSMLTVTYADHSALGRAQGAILLLVAALLYIGHLDRNKLIPLQPFSEADRKAALIVLAVVCAGTLLALATGKLGFQGVQTGEDNTVLVSPLASLMVSALTPVLALTALAFGNQPPSRMRTIALVLGLVLAATLMTQGRRLFLFNTIAVLIALFATRNMRTLLTPRMAVLVLLVIVSAWGASRFFVSMRVAGYSLPPTATIQERVTGAFDVLMNPQMYNLDEVIEENQSTRTFVVGYLAELIEASDATQRTTEGDLLLLNVATSVPTAIWAGKWEVISRVGSDENACHPKLGMPAWDAANSIITEGLCDFRWPGMLIYPLAVVWLMTLANLAVRRAPVVVRTLVCFATVGSLLHVEGVLTGYLVGLRNIAMMAIVTWLLSYLFERYSQLPSVVYARREKAARKALRRERGLS